MDSLIIKLLKQFDYCIAKKRSFLKIHFTLIPQTKSINSVMYGGSRIHNQISKFETWVLNWNNHRAGLKIIIFFNKGN
jgi:hypothetical protein